MKGLRKYLTPFAPDQSGAESVLYDLGGMVVILDAGGCTGNICGFDEPRWSTMRSAVFSAGLRDMDAIFGRDKLLVEKTASAAEKIRAEFIAIIGTPVPSVIGTDYKAVKRMLEKRVDVPVLTVETNGMRLYDRGAQDAYMALFSAFAREKAGTEESQAGRTGPEEGQVGSNEDRGCPNESESSPNESKACPDEGRNDFEERQDNPKGGRIGVLGADPLDLPAGEKSARLLREALEEEGAEPLLYGSGAPLSAYRDAFLNRKNIVVSPSGMKAALFLQKKYGTPFEACYPGAGKVLELAVEKAESRRGQGSTQKSSQGSAPERAQAGNLENIQKSAQSGPLENGLGSVQAGAPEKVQGTSQAGPQEEGRKSSIKKAIEKAEKILVVQQQVLGNSLREELEKRSPKAEIRVASWFSMLPGLAREGDLSLKEEDDFIRLVQEEKFNLVLGDEVLLKMMRGWDGAFLPITQFALSGKKEAGQ